MTENLNAGRLNGTRALLEPSVGAYAWFCTGVCFTALGAFLLVAAPDGTQGQALAALLLGGELMLVGVVHAL